MSNSPNLGSDVVKEKPRSEYAIQCPLCENRHFLDRKSDGSEFFCFPKARYLSREEVLGTGKKTSESEVMPNAGSRSARQHAMPEVQSSGSPASQPATNEGENKEGK
jgi:hypothetical protein